MLIVFPLLVDETVSPNIIPGVCKALEQFCLERKTDQILKMGGLSSDTVLSNIVSMGAEPLLGSGGRYLKNMIGGVSEGVLNEVSHDDLDYEKQMRQYRDDEINRINREKNQLQRDKNIIDQERLKHSHDIENKRLAQQAKEFEHQKGRPEDRRIEVNPMEFRSNLSITPTTCQATSKKGTFIIGIKVIPYAISSEPFIKQLLQDNSLSFFDRFLARYERGITRAFYTIMRRLPYFKNIPIDKDPFKDVIYARSKFGKNIFCMLNLVSLENDDMFKSQGGVDRLIRLGWNSLIIADDVTKRIVFCMKEYGGMCESTHYGFLYSALGKQGQEAYEKLEDLRKSTSPLWSQKMRPSKLFGESLANDYKNRFVDLGLPCLKGDCK